jgi:hypothetical protein
MDDLSICLPMITAMIGAGSAYPAQDTPTQE